MTVDELIEALSLYPPDLEVHVRRTLSDGLGVHCGHVARLVRHPAGRTIGTPSDRFERDERLPGALVIEFGVHWFDEPPPVTFEGPRYASKDSRRRRAR